MAHHHSKQPTCANCHLAFDPGQPDEFCPRCGQQNHAVDINFYHVVEEFLEGVFHFDGKVFNTAKLLLFKPGELTRKFLAGHRVPYVPPIRLYVFISFLFFFLLSLQRSNSADKHRKPVAEAVAKADSLTTRADSARLARMSREVGVTLGAGDSTLQAEENPLGARQSFTKLLDFSIPAEEMARLPEDISAAQVDSVLISKKAPLTFKNRLLLRRGVRWRNATSEEIKHQGLRGLSLTMFLLMPLAALLLKGFYFRQQRYYLGHLIFTIHLQCFMLLFIGALLLLNKVPVVRELTDWIWWLPGLYFVLALRRVYGQSWGKTLVKAVALGVTYWLTVVFVFMLVGAVGLAVF